MSDWNSNQLTFQLVIRHLREVLLGSGVIDAFQQGGVQP